MIFAQVGHTKSMLFHMSIEILNKNAKSMQVYEEIKNNYRET